MNDEAAIREVMQRLALAGFFYYPEIHVDDDEYSLDGDLEWAFGEVSIGEGDDRTILIDLAKRFIIDPTTHRRALFDALAALIDPAT